ncbi:MAG: camphor resistance protein CrcB [Sphingobacteriia bacterium 24-36-13]|jgi:CrcB protein|uniref:fluoride efflux transporter CrcB n=1 Tax=Chitinophagaceae TaxID=563835 RepID=UPI000BC78443|nr:MULTISPECIES: fluoride efflux transporter CrcB [Chitinophagaceae]OYY11605.1 MAG: camphor resistance protein CrcB [Sphingobacteriia bacterium 35-36-14]OYZ55309.1 MAG: camphor resistance protein CrcB [Sphingobacteriia bacterium 24-36-13]OZA66269.1 MAG: camphor resistance protein CrcB [Sphingobacteriia bacterium 39-36-14]RWZ89419.1 MAG: fluoride efflux transporter CrcB [Hydrotalea sp. AMD]HQS22846.1 fluoride efflux transporter CrcB [Sediminibacterium sp.]
MIKLFFIVGLGGALGSFLRYCTGILFSKWHLAAFPYSTFTVNILGSLIIGLLFSTSEKYHWISLNWRLFLITGFCGGFTTFSTFAYENIKLLQEGNTMYFILYSVGSYALSLLAVIAGISIIKIF